MSPRRALLATGVGAAVLATLSVPVAIIVTGRVDAPTAVSPPPTGHTGGGATGGSLPSRTVLTDFAPLTTGGEPPHDILEALAVPEAATMTTVANRDGNAGGFDRSITYTDALSVSQLTRFFESTLRSHGWNVGETFSTPTPGGVQILARHSGADGFYWDVGITISPASATTSPIFVVRLQRVEDSS